MVKNKIKSIKHRMKNGKLQLKTIEIVPANFNQVQELAFVSVMADFLETNGINEDVISFLDDAVAGNKTKRAIATKVAESLLESFAEADVGPGDIKSVEMVNIDAYDSPEEFFKEKGWV